MKVTTAKQLGEAIKSNENTIEIEGDLAKKVFRIKATGTVAWAVAIGALSVAVTAAIMIPATGGVSTPVSSALVATMAPTAAVALGGTGVASIAGGIAIAGGGVAALNKLRKYKMEKLPNNSIRLLKK